MWQIAASLLQANQKQQADEQAGDAAKKDSERQRILQNRMKAQQAQGQTMSANYGKFDVQSLIDGVFSTQKNGGGIRG